MQRVFLPHVGRFALLAALGSAAAASHADELPAGQDMAIYLTPDGEHAIIGTLVDSEGSNLTEAQLDEHVRAPLEAETWKLLEESRWIQDGDPDAPRVIYTFTDANCPYCRAPNSPALAATILGADDPSAALHRHSEGDELSPSAQPRDIEEQVYANNQLFEELGLYATPTSAFQREAEGGTVRIDRIQGLPSQERLIEMMGSEAP